MLGALWGYSTDIISLQPVGPCLGLAYQWLPCTVQPCLTKGVLLSSDFDNECLHQETCLPQTADSGCHSPQCEPRPRPLLAACHTCQVLLA